MAWGRGGRKEVQCKSVNDRISKMVGSAFTMEGADVVVVVKGESMYVLLTIEVIALG